MSETVLEMATITLAPGKTEAELVAASEVFQRDFLNNQPGFLRREMVRKDDGTYVDVILWNSRAEADAVFERAQSSEAAGTYFAQMQFDPETMDSAVQHCPVLGAYSAG